QAMKEIWKASAQPSDWNGQSVPSLLPWWWLLWIVSSVLDNLSFRLSMNAATLDELVYANIVTQVSDALTVPLCLVFLAIVRGVHGMQMAQAKTGG
ncbi:MAG TPA: DUF4328 domain-containing protein, partial [Gammaproteobacteria bacterium]|nr:DUF4328 domain-containing protein [Gammaproteobacteria bacterium]